MCCFFMPRQQRASSTCCEQQKPGGLRLFSSVVRATDQCAAVCIILQGEEATVVILSLVRSREDGNIGFLKLQVRSDCLQHGGLQ
jgi:hypothetical protein